jgi:uncharacterized protein (TIGR03435 family)
MRFSILSTVLLVAGAAWAQIPAAPATAAVPLQFEVATIKPAPPLNPAAIQAGKMHVGMKIDAARVDIGYLSLADLIMTAYKVKSHQVVGPDWMKTERFDILAKMPEGATKEQVPEMLQGLLAERFKLTFHKDTREQPVYGLLVAKGGPRLKESSKEEEAPFDDKDKGGTISFGGGQVKQTANGAVIKAEGQPGTMKMTMVEGKMHMESTKATMAGFADMLSRFVGKPVVDMTELKGNYDLTIEVSMQELMAIARTAGVAVPGMGAPAPGADSGRPADAASDPSTSGSIFASVQQLGLKLESRKSAVETIVVDKVEKTPTEN